MLAALILAGVGVKRAFVAQPPRFKPFWKNRILGEPSVNLKHFGVTAILLHEIIEHFLVDLMTAGGAETAQVVKPLVSLGEKFLQTRPGNGQVVLHLALGLCCFAVIQQGNQQVEGNRVRGRPGLRRQPRCNPE